MTSRLDQRRLNVVKWDGRGRVPSPIVHKIQGTHEKRAMAFLLKIRAKGTEVYWGGEICIDSHKYMTLVQN
jgi:hypothetical protein